MNARKAVSRVWGDIEKMYAPEESSAGRRTYRSIGGHGIVGTAQFVSELREVHPHLARIRPVTLHTTINELWRERGAPLRPHRTSNGSRDAAPQLALPAEAAGADGAEVFHFRVPAHAHAVRFTVHPGQAPGCVFEITTPGQRITQ